LSPVSDSRHVIAVTVPEPLHAAVKTAADMDMSTVSDWLRRVMLEKLREHGLDPRVLPTRPASAASAGPASTAAAEQRATA
jgi:hypothetical protein